MKTKKANMGFKILVYSTVIVFSLFCVVPFLLVLSASFTSDNSLAYGVSLFPEQFSVSAYRYIFKFPNTIIRAYGVSIFITVVGTLLNMALMIPFAYAISKTDFTYGRIMTFILFFTVMFSGGMVPMYILIKKYLHMFDTIWVLIIPWLVTPGHVILLRMFFRVLPQSLFESASLDGGNEYQQLFRVGIPLIMPGVATIAFFSILQFWNDSYTAIIYTESPDLVPVQVFLTQMSSYIQYIKQNGSAMGGVNVTDLPTQSILYAMCVVACAPMLLLFSFFQKYFVKGLTAGSVKE